jgi:hypothetical protein
MNQKLVNIIKSYRNLRTKTPDNHLRHCESQDSLENAIYYAATATDDKGKRHGHQRRLKRVDLIKYADNLFERIEDIKKVKTFDRLYEVASECANKGIGSLAIYDTAHRIGRYLRIMPDKIYLHAGTRAGAKKLLGQLKGKTFLTKNDLPAEFQIGDIDAEEIEDILCIYKERL